MKKSTDSMIRVIAMSVALVIFAICVLLMTISVIRSMQHDVYQSSLYAVMAAEDDYREYLEKISGQGSPNVNSVPDHTGSVEDTSSVVSSDDDSKSEEESDVTSSDVTSSETTVSEAANESDVGSVSSASSNEEVVSGGQGVESTDETLEVDRLPSYADICVRNSDGDWVYIVKRGESLSIISGKVGYSVQQLAQYNQIENWNLIFTGQAIRIPKD